MKMDKASKTKQRTPMVMRFDRYIMCTWKKGNTVVRVRERVEKKEICRHLMCTCSFSSQGSNDIHSLLFSTKYMSDVCLVLFLLWTRLHHPIIHFPTFDMKNISHASSGAHLYSLNDHFYSLLIMGLICFVQHQFLPPFSHALFLWWMKLNRWQRWISLLHERTPSIELRFR